MHGPSIIERIQDLRDELDELRRQAAEGTVDFDGRNLSLAITALEDAESRCARARLA